VCREALGRHTCGCRGGRYAATAGAEEVVRCRDEARKKFRRDKSFTST